MSLLPYAAAIAAFHIDFAFADDNGGLGNVPTITAPSGQSSAATNTESDKKLGIVDSKDTRATNSLLTDSKNTDTKNTAQTAKNTQTANALAGSSGSQSFNVWGFTGSQSRWSESAATSGLSAHLSGSLSSRLALALSLSTKSSGAVPISFQSEPVNWKSITFIGIIAVSTFGLHCL